VLVSCLSYSSSLKTEAICFSETSDDFHLTSSHYIPEDGRHLADKPNLKYINSKKILSDIHFITNHIYYGIKYFNLIREEVPYVTVKGDCVQQKLRNLSTNILIRFSH
jgi:hypothetical protein